MIKLTNKEITKRLYEIIGELIQAETIERLGEIGEELRSIEKLLEG